MHMGEFIEPTTLGSNNKNLTSQVFEILICFQHLNIFKKDFLNKILHRTDPYLSMHIYNSEIHFWMLLMINYLHYDDNIKISKNHTFPLFLIEQASWKWTHQMKNENTDIISSKEHNVIRVIRFCILICESD